MSWKNSNKLKRAIRKQSMADRTHPHKVDSTNDIQLQLLKNKEILIDSLLHELRTINGNLKDCLDLIDFRKVERNIVDIWAQANLLSIRMQMYDFEVNPEVLAGSGKYDIPIYRRVEKIYKCLDNAHFKKNIKIELKGNCHQTYNASDILEIAFYIIIHNAIKYAPEKSSIIIEFIETGNTVQVTFSNQAILPTKEEQPRLTERGYRGTNAQRGNVPGSGIGLNTLQKICAYQGVLLNIDTIVTPPYEDIGIFRVILTFTACKPYNTLYNEY